jgi:hypothetical protein
MPMDEDMSSPLSFNLIVFPKNRVINLDYYLLSVVRPLDFP